VNFFITLLLEVVLLDEMAVAVLERQRTGE